MKSITRFFWTPRFDNTVEDAMNPELWANEALFQLYNKLVMANLVHRDFEDEIQQFGDVVNAHRPSKLTATRKGVNSDIVPEDVVAENVPVKLDQHWYSSFIIKDGEESKSFKSLIDLYLVPAMEAVAQAIDRALHDEAFNFIQNGGVGQLGVEADARTVTGARKKLNQNAVPMSDRYFVFNECVEESFLNIDKFITADKIGDRGEALAEGTLGRKMGFWMIMSQNVPSIAAAGDTITRAVNSASGYAAGATSIDYDGAGGSIVVGSWCTIEGDNTPQKITADSGTALTIAPGLQRAVADDAVITIVEPALVNNGSGYAAGYAETLTVDDLTAAIQFGQLVSTGTAADGPVYGAMDLKNGESATEVLTSRPLDEALADNAVVGLGPAGSYNLAFHRNALALVSRPLAAPRAATGVQSAVVNFNGIAVRIVMTYDGTKQGTLVTVDILGGVKTLDTRMGAVVYAN